MPESHQTLLQAEIEVLRKIGDGITANTMKIETMSAKLDDVRERVIRLEEQKVHKLVDDVRLELDKALERINVLESDKDTRSGAMKLVGWISEHAPWLVAIGASIAAAFHMGTGVKPG